MSVHAQRGRRTLRSLPFERQAIMCDGLVKAVAIPDYQIRLRPGGEYHRRGGLETEVACGEAMGTDSTSVAMRAYRLDEQLCTRGCFSPRELELGRAFVGERRSALGFDVSDEGDERDKRSR